MSTEPETRNEQTNQKQGKNTRQENEAPMEHMILTQKSSISGMKDTIEYAGSRAERRRNAYGIDLEKTTNIFYTSMINYVRQLIKLTTECLTKEKGLVSSELFTGKLKTKKTLISCDTCANNDHAHFCCAQRLLLKFTFSYIECLLEEVELDIESPITLPEHLGVEAHSHDDEC
eukprot:15335338-Ditylum_brightwellii.AAC.1